MYNTHVSVLVHTVISHHSLYAKTFFKNKISPFSTHGNGYYQADKIKNDNDAFECIFNASSR